MFIQLAKYQVKDMNVHIDITMYGITMYDISRPIGERQFQFYTMHVWTIHDALGLTHFCGL